MRNESFYVIVDNDILEYSQVTGVSTTNLWESAKFESYEEAKVYINDILGEDYKEHAEIYKVNMEYYFKKCGEVEE